MKRFYFIIVFSLFSILIANTQNLSKAEKAAVDCIDEKLSKADKSREYLLSSIDEFYKFASKMDFESFNKKNSEIDSILAICGFYKENHLQMTLLINCLESDYDLNSNKIDTTTSYYNLLIHLKDLADNPNIMKELSPAIQLEAIKLIISEDVADKEIYKIYTFILFQGIAKEFENYAQKMKKSDNNSIIDNSNVEEQEIEVISIVDDEVEIVSFDKIENSSEESIFVLVEKMPEFPGGQGAFDKYLRSEIKYPESEKKIKGRVYVTFVIDKTGKVTNPKIVRGISPEYDNEALRVIKSMPDWTPGEQNGVNVNVMITYFINFE